MNAFAIFCLLLINYGDSESTVDPRENTLDAVWHDYEDIFWDDSFEISDLPTVYAFPAYPGVDEEPFTYHTAMKQLKNLKAILYDNLTKITDEEIAPPGGSRLKFSKDKDGFEIITKVGMRISPDRIVRMSIEEQALTLVLQEDLFWTDERLQWERNGSFLIKDIFLNSSEIWTPPVNVKGITAQEEIIDTGMVLVYSDGLCYMTRIIEYTMPCTVNVEDFPFDMHTCFMSYDQGTPSHQRLFFSTYEDGGNSSRAESLRLNKQYAHLEWRGVSASQDLMAVGGRDNMYLQFTVTLQRQSHFYAIVLIFPTVLLNVLSLVVFTLPINNTERENFSLTLILTYFVLVMIIVDTSPPTGNQVPKLGLYVIMCTVIVVVTFGMSLILIELHEHKRAKKRKMSDALFGFLKKFCCFEKCYSDYRRQARDGTYDMSEDSAEEDKLPMMKNSNKHGTVETKREEFKWKLLANILNYIFLVCTVIAHLTLPCLLFLL